MTELRVGDAERDRAAVDLGEHFALGRLTADEHAERLDAAWTARTRADLAVLFEDLPAHPARPATGSPASRERGGPAWRPVPFVPLLVLLVVLSAVTHLPLWLGAFALGAVLFSRARRGSRRTAWSASPGW